MAALPDLVQIHEQFKDQGVVFIGLTGEGPTALPEIQAIVHAHPGLKWPIGYGAEPTLEKLGWDRRVPTYLLVDKRGQIVWSSNSHHRLEEQLVRLVAK